MSPALVVVLALALSGPRVFLTSRYRLAPGAKLNPAAYIIGPIFVIYLVFIAPHILSSMTSSPATENSNVATNPNAPLQFGGAGGDIFVPDFASPSTSTCQIQPAHGANPETWTLSHSGKLGPGPEDFVIKIAPYHGAGTYGAGALSMTMTVSTDSDLVAAIANPATATVTISAGEAAGSADAQLRYIPTASNPAPSQILTTVVGTFVCSLSRG